MKAYAPLGNFTRILEKTRSALDQGQQVPDPFDQTALSPDLDYYRSLVADGRRLLPTRYHSDYLDVLDFAVRQAASDLERGGPARKAAIMRQLQSVFSTLAAPLVQLADPRWSRRLRAYQAVISNFYRRFLDDRHIRYQMTRVARWPELDPLGYFLNSGSGPFTLAPSRELPLAFVAKPASYACFAPLFFIEAHEVGGHVFHSAVAGLEDEIEGRLGKRLSERFSAGDLVFSRKTVRVPKRPGLLFRRDHKYVQNTVFVSHVWQKWLPELLSDLAGVLNLGPAYVNGLIAFLTAIEPTLSLRTASRFDLDQGFSSHPPSLVRARFCLSVVSRLDFPDLAVWKESLDRRIGLAAGNAPADLVWQDGDGNRAVSFKLDEMLQVLEDVVDTVLDTAVAALGDRSLASIMTWGKSDELTARQLADALLEGNVHIDEPLEARHVVAASILALEIASAKDGSRADFEKSSDAVHGNALELLSALYTEQCLLCEVPAFQGTRRHDLNLSELARLVQRLREDSARFSTTF